jgi:hypothetical protein
MLNAFKLYAKKNLMLTAYLSTNHWIAVAIVPEQQKDYYLDSMKTINTRCDKMCVDAKSAPRTKHTAS